MAQPTAYNRQASFSNIQAQAPADPLPGNTLDAEFNAVKVTLDELRANIALIQRDDGAVANASIGLDQLSEEIEVGWQAPEVWVTATAYAVGNTVFETSSFYRCLVAHTAGTFATDLAAAKWEEIVDLSTLTIVAADQIAVTPAGGIAATDVQTALEELDSEKAASSHTHPSSAISDSTAAGRSMLAAATAAAQRTLLGLGALALEDTVPVTDIDAEIALSGIIAPAALSASVNDWAPTGIATCSTIRLSASASGVEITGILAPAADGAILVLENDGSTYAVTLPPSSSSSAAANRFLVPKPIVIGPNSSVVLKYDLDGTTPRWRLFDRSGSLPRGHIDGLKLSNNSGDATNDIDIAAGEARGARGILDLVLTTALTGKQLDADWAAGSSAGMRESTAIDNVSYHIFLIGKADGTTDVFAYTGVDPTSVLPSGYIDYHMLGSIMRESAAIVPFVQTGDKFRRKVPKSISQVSNPGTSAILHTLGVPTGLSVEVGANISLSTGSAGSTYVLVTSPDETDTAASGTAFNFLVAGAAIGGGLARAVTDTSGRIRTRNSTSHATSTLDINVQEWTHPRGRNG